MTTQYQELFSDVIQTLEEIEKATRGCYGGGTIFDRVNSLARDCSKRITSRKDDRDTFLTGRFQTLVVRWAKDCFGEGVALDRTERTHRFLEEALELAHACDCTREEAIQLVDYVFARPVGSARQEIGGVILTLALLGEAYNYNVAEEGRIELNNVYRRIGEIREEQANKPKVGPLPGPSAVSFSHLAAKQKILGALLVIQKEIECLDREAAAAK